MYKKTLRPAIAMIELIFALVIMGIVLMTAPMLISTAAKSGYVAIQQEAINEAASQVNMIMGYHWDESNSNEDYLPSILITNGNSELHEVNISSQPTGRRLGTPKESYRAFVRSDGRRLSATPIASGNTDKNDINDFAGDTDLTLIKTSTAEYVETTTININTAISYSTDSGSGYNNPSITYDPFTASGGTTNIKSIIVTLTNPGGVAELNKTIELRAFSCNIGGYKLEEKSF